MGTENASSSLSSSSSMYGWTYDVFLSFRGSDTRKNFTDHLYAALKQKGIFTFRDDEKLKRRTFITPELLKAIQESRFAIVILSKDYASSSWCLIELTKIVECIKNTGLIVLPIFHYVDTSDVRNQRKTFAEAFVKHEERFKDNIEDVYKWRDALAQVAGIAGWDLFDKHESRVIEEIVGKLFSKLNSMYSSVHKDLVGIKPHVEKMIDSYLHIGLNDVRFIGIWGMGGMGKTTLAQVIYDRINLQFEGSSFIASVRGKSGDSLLVSLQKQLLSDILIESNIDIRDIQWGMNVIKKRLCRKRVLIILDDVDQYEQLEALVGEQDWFGQGSRIIIITRNKHLLIQHKVPEAGIYKAKELNNNEALQLFSLKAFNRDSPSKDYVELSQEIIYYANGLPLALKVLGSFLFGRSLEAWKSEFGRLKESPEREILDVLQISFDGLKEREKNIFLDIACFFNKQREDYVANILRTLYDNPIIDMDVLKEKSLINISWPGKLDMHDLLQELGREIVRRDSPEELGQRSRLWLSEDIFHVLKYSEGTPLLKVKGIFLDPPPEKEEHLNVKTFSNMKNLRLLKISNVHLPQGLNYLSGELRFIHWNRFPLESIPTSFELDKLVELNMPCSLIKQLWKGIKRLERLKLIDLRDSWNLIETPDFNGVPNLEHLILQRCTRLSKIHTSLGDLKWLLQLDMSGCKSLESLLPKISLESLEVLILSGCSRLKKFPEIVGNMSRLSQLYLDGTAIKELPLSVEHLTGLVKLDLSGSAIREWSFSTFPSKNIEILSFSRCEGLSYKPSNKLIGFPLMRRASPDPLGMLVRSLLDLRSLIDLDLSYCNLRTIPDDLGCLSFIKGLNLRGNNFVSLPDSIIQLSDLIYLLLGNCTGLRSLPELPSNINFVQADGCISLETLPLIPEHSCMPGLSLLNCFKLVDNQGYGEMFFTMLRHYIQFQMQMQCDEELWSYNVVTLGSEIPKWISHQGVTSVNLQLSSALLNERIGFVVCAVFVFSENHPVDQLPSDIWERSLTCYFKVKGAFTLFKSISRGISEEFGKIGSHHLWLAYSSILFNQSQEILSLIDANGYIQIEISFEPKCPGMVINKCGACLVYEQDIIEDHNQTMAGSSNIRITPYEDDFDDSAKDTKIKPNLDDYDGAGPSGEGSSSDITTTKEDTTPQYN